MPPTGVRVTTTISIVLAASFVAAACGRQEETPPAATPAPPTAAPALELPDSAAAAVPAQPNEPTDTASGRQPNTPPGTARAGSATATAGTAQQPRPKAPLLKPAPSSSGPEPQPPAAQATPQDEAAAVLQRAAAAYANVRALRADFVMQYSNPLLRQQTTSRGTLYQRRPDRIALVFSDPAGDVILSDGQFYWVYYPSVDAAQVIRCAAAEGGEQGVDLQAQFVGDPVRRFRYTLDGQESVGGRAAHVLTLEPRERTDYRTLKVWLDTRDSLARRFEITEHNNTVRRFDLSDFEVNPAIPDATFRFTPPAGSRVVSCG
jgi:outer membrane lipoprotein carrier protein